MTRALIAVRTRLACTDRESGATAVEYGLMVSLIAVAISGTVTILGTTLSGLFGTVTGSL